MESEGLAQEDSIAETQPESEESVNAEVVSIRDARLARLRKRMKKIRKMREEDLESYKQELKECKDAFTEANSLLGAIDDSGGNQNHGS